MIEIDTVISILVALLVFGVIIFVHEFGHFFTAKLFGIQVNEFAIGMGPKIVGWGKGETKYSLRALPIGGYCAMEGEDGGEDENPRAFNRKPKWQRGIVLVAGGAMNLILGFILMFSITVSTELFSTTTVSNFRDYAVSNSSVNGGDYLCKNDEILKVNNVSTHVAMDLSFALMTDSDGVVDILVKRNGEEVLLKDVTFNTEDEQGITYTTIDFQVWGTDNALHHIFDTKGQPVLTHIGNCFVSLGKAFAETWYSVIGTVRQVWVTIIDMVSGKYSLTDLSGPVGTTAAMGDAVSMGLESLILIAMFITVNLGIVNLLPFPALDGGRVVLLGVEAIRRKPLPPKVEAGINAAGLILLLSLMVIVSFFDIGKLFN